LGARQQPGLWGTYGTTGRAAEPFGHTR
jgi:hypothetical protein